MSSYSAGTAYVSVQPETRNFRQRLSREMAAIKQSVDVPVGLRVDDSALKSLRTAIRALPATVVVNGDTSAAQRQVAELRTRLETLSSKTIGVDISTVEAQRQVAGIRTELDRLGAKSPDIAVQVDTGAASAALSRFDAEVDRVDGRAARLRVDADATAAIGQMAAVRAAAGQLDGRRININADFDAGRALAGIASLASAVVAANSLSVRPHIDVDVSGAVASISSLIAKVSALGGLAGVVGGFGGALGGLGAAGAVAAGGLGTVVLASGGVGKALSAMSAQQDSAASTARQSAQQQAQAAYQVESAQIRLQQASASANQARRDGARSVAQAEQAASRSVQSALDQQAAAQQRLVRAQRDARIAQQQLTSAWEAGRRALQDLQDQLDSSVLDQRQAALDLKDARKQLAEAQASGNADEIERAQLAYDRANESVDQLGKRTQRLQVDNTNAQRAGVAGTDQYRQAVDRVTAAQEQVSDAARAAGQASAAVDQARRDGAAQVAQAQEQAQQRIASADQQVLEAQRALTQAMSQTGSAGQAAADKVAQAFANLSPAAADFARFLFGLKPLLDQLSATAAAGFFPPLQQGISALVAQLPIINTVVGQLASGMGVALRGVLTELANPFWMGFFQTLGNAAGTVLPGLFGALMAVARAGAGLVTALLPLAPAGFAIVTQFAGLISSLTPFLVQLLGGLIPAASAFLSALTPLGPVLGALQPILLVLGQAFSTVLGAALTALAPVLQALTPFIQYLADALAAQLVGAIQALTPFLVGLATWMSQNPALVMGLIGAVLGAIPVFNALGAVFSALFTPIGLLRLGMMLFGGSLTGLLAPLGAVGGFIGGLLAKVASAFSPLGVLSTLLRGAGSAVMGLGRMILGALGPVGWIITAFGLLYATSAPFRDAINQILAVFAQLVGQLVGAVMPIFQALSGVVQMVAGVFGMLVGQLAAALIPVINLVAGILTQLVAAVLPPLMAIIQALLPVIMLLAQVFVQLVMAAVQPLMAIFQTLISAILPPLVGILQSVVIPVITFLANVIGAVLVWVIQNVLVPALQALVPIFQWVGAIAMWLWTNAIQPAFNAIGTFIGWVWNTLIKPALDALVWFWQNVIAPVAMWLWTNIIQPTFNAIGAFIAFVWNYIIKPAFDALVWFITTIIVPAINWLWNNIVRPVFQALGDFIAFVWNNIIRPAFDAIKQGLQWVGEKFDQAVNWIRDIWERIRGILAKPINFLINTVWNNGILTAWNAVAGLVGIPPIAPLAPIPEAASGGYLGGTQAAAGGGKLRGPGTPTSDSILGVDGRGMATAKVSRDEFVVNAAVTKRTLPFLTALNSGQGEALQAAGGLARVAPKKYQGRNHHGFDVNVPRRAGGGLAGLPHLAAGGGPFQQRIDQAKAWLSGPARGAPYVYGGGTNPRAGMDCSSMQSAVTHILSGRPPDSGRIGTTASMPWGGFAPGLNSQYSIGNKPSDHMAGTLAGQNVEQHGPNGTPFSFPSRWGADNGYFTQRWNLPIVGGEFVSGGEGGGWFNWILDKARSVFDEFTNPAIDAIRGFVGDPPPEWRRVPVGLATLIRDKARDFIFGKAEEAGGGSGMDVSGITGPVVDQVRQVAARFGWDQGPEWDAIMKIVAKESTWNPNARNSSTSAAGLFQKMQSKHGPVEPTPAGQAAWGLDYIRGRYGSPTRAWAFHQANGWYARGGQVKPFDAGGIARGKGIMFKDVIAPERTLDPQETQAYPTLTRLSQQLEAGRIRISTQSGADVNALPGAGSGASAAVQIGSVVVPPGATANDLAREVTWQVRSARRGGVYS